MDREERKRKAAERKAQQEADREALRKAQAKKQRERDERIQKRLNAEAEEERVARKAGEKLDREFEREMESFFGAPLSEVSKQLRKEPAMQKHIKRAEKYARKGKHRKAKSVAKRSFLKKAFKDRKKRKK